MLYCRVFVCFTSNYKPKGKSSGAFQLLQLQEDIRKQFKIDGSGLDNDVETHLISNKEILMSSLWKLNVVDIEVTLVHVCQMVSFRSRIICVSLFMSYTNFLSFVGPQRKQCPQRTT